MYTCKTKIRDTMTKTVLCLAVSIQLGTFNLNMNIYIKETEHLYILSRKIACLVDQFSSFR